MNTQSLFARSSIMVINGGFIMPLLSVVFVKLLAPQSVGMLINHPGSIIDIFKQYWVLVLPLLLVICAGVGLLLDIVGHLVLDEKLFGWTRENVVSVDDQKAIRNALKSDLGVSFEVLIQAIFYTHAPKHLQDYHYEQWSFYGFYRNMFTGIAINAVALCILLVLYRNWVLFALVIPATVVLLIYIRSAMFWVIAYYYRLETIFAIGWLTDHSMKDEGERVPLIAPVISYGKG